VYNAIDTPALTWRQLLKAGGGQRRLSAAGGC